MILLIEMQTPSFECTIQVDKHQLSQVVRNLVSNAIKFSKRESTINITVDVITDQDNGDGGSTSSGQYINDHLPRNNNRKMKKELATHYIRFSVTDTGAGISKVLTFN
jgi:signal transduction histidine kinase